MPSTTIHVSAVARPAERETILRGLAAHNANHGFASASEDLAVVARAPDGTIRGGLLGHTNLGWLFVSALWVDEPLRRQGIGRSIMASAEEEATRRGCVGVYLDTNSFQARPFYERLGYQVFGTLDDCPRGATKYFVSRRLAPDATAAAGEGSTIAEDLLSDYRWQTGQ